MVELSVYITFWFWLLMEYALASVPLINILVNYEYRCVLKEINPGSSTWIICWFRWQCSIVCTFFSPSDSEVFAWSTFSAIYEWTRGGPKVTWRAWWATGNVYSTLLPSRICWKSRVITMNNDRRRCYSDIVRHHTTRRSDNVKIRSHWTGSRKEEDRRSGGLTNSEKWFGWSVRKCRTGRVRYRGKSEKRPEKDEKKKKEKSIPERV